MLENKKMQIRLSEELYSFLRKKTENTSLFVRNIIREKMDLGLDADDQSAAYEIRARTPYIYFAKLYRVVDGDTLWLDIDLGFFTTERIDVRLCNIDAPPLNTKKGQKAYEFIVKELTKCNLVAETRKKEKYGRYLAFIYYHPKFTEFDDIVRYGKSINEELVSHGLAEKYEDSRYFIGNLKTKSDKKSIKEKTKKRSRKRKDLKKRKSSLTKLKGRKQNVKKILIKKQKAAKTKNKKIHLTRTKKGLVNTKNKKTNARKK